MNDRLPSLDLLLELVQRERDKQLAHLDALDNKAGIVLGFAGLLITLAPDVPRLTVHDTLEDFVNEGSDILQSKGRRLGRALASLSLAATVLALGIVVEAL